MTSARHRLLIPLLAVVLVVSSGGLTLAQALPDQPLQPLQPRPTEAPDDPPVIATVPPRPTAVPTLPPRPTAVPTNPPRPTAVPTTSPRPTAEPTLVPRPTAPPVDLGPTIPPPTVPVLDPMPGPPGEYEQPSNIPVFTPLVTGTVVNSTRLCPTEFNPYMPTLTYTDLYNACIDAPHQAGFGTMTDTWAKIHTWEDDGGAASYQATIGFRRNWIYLTEGFEFVGTWCGTAVPPARPQLQLLEVGSYEVTIYVTPKSVTTCTWFLHSAVELADLSVTAWQCPVGYDWQAAGVSPAADCLDPVDDLAVPLLDETDKDADYFGDTGDDGPGQVIFTNNVPDTYYPTVAHMTATFPVPSAILGSCTPQPVAPLEIHTNDDSWWARPGPVVLASGDSVACTVYLIPVA